jgi:large subunit ribosomal protein L31e
VIPMKLERIYTVPLGKANEAARYRRTARAVKLLRAFIARHMKADGERITISAALNGFLWQRSIKKPPKRVKVRLIKDSGMIKAYLADEKVEEPKKKAEEKKEEQKKEAAVSKEAGAAHGTAAKEGQKKEPAAGHPAARKEEPKHEPHREAAAHAGHETHAGAKAKEEKK